MKPRIKIILLCIFGLVCAALCGAEKGAPKEAEKPLKDEKKQTECEDSQQRFPTHFYSFVDPSWPNWQKRSYKYGIDPSALPVPIFFDTQIATDGTIMVRGKNNWKKRWGLHVFEAYAADDTSRITMILNKHVEEGLPVAELYYYASVYGQGFNAYNWFRIGSDVPYHSFLFGRDKAIFYGEVELKNLLRLDNIGKEDLLDEKPEQKISNYPLPRENYKSDADHKHARWGLYYKEESKFLKKQALKKAKDGTIFYDRDNKIVVVKIDGKWKRVMVEDLPAGVEYPSE